MSMKKLIALILALGMLVSLASCTPQSLKVDEGFDQFAPAAAGEDIAVIKVKDFGEITVKFFPQYAPKAVENFIALAKDGKYNGSEFHRVMQDFMIQGGRPAAGGEGESMWGQGFGIEVTANLHHFPGALCMARTGPQGQADSDKRKAMTTGQGCQFYIVQATDEAKETYSSPGIFANLENNMTSNFLVDYEYPQSVKDMYKKVGGAASLDMGYTIFGQVIAGMDIVDKIAAIGVEAQNEQNTEESKPKSKVEIESITVKAAP